MLRRPEHQSSFRFSIADVPARERRNAVCELRERGVLPIEPLPDCDLQLDIAKWVLPGVGIMSGALCGVRQEGTPKSVGASDELFFGLNLAGHSARTGEYVRRW